MFRTPESRILDLERKAGTQTDKRFLVIIDGDREQAELESFGHVLSDRERTSLERVNIEITGSQDVDPGIVKRLEEIAARNASEPPWVQEYGTVQTPEEPEIVLPGEPEGPETKLQTGDRGPQRNESIIRMLESY